MVEVIELAPKEPNSPENNKKKTLFKTYAFVWYLVSILDALLGARFLLRALAANPRSPFVSFIYSISEPFVSPFRGIFGTPAEGGYVIDTATLVAMIVYLVVAYLFTEFLRLAKPTSSEEADKGLGPS